MARDLTVEPSDACYICGRIGEHHVSVCPQNTARGSLHRSRAQTRIKTQARINPRGVRKFKTPVLLGERLRKEWGAIVTHAELDMANDSHRVDRASPTPSQVAVFSSSDDKDEYAHIHKSRRDLLENAGSWDGGHVLAQTSATRPASPMRRVSASALGAEQENHRSRDHDPVGQPFESFQGQEGRLSSCRAEADIQDENRGAWGISDQALESTGHSKPRHPGGPIILERDFKELIDGAQAEVCLCLKSVPDL